MLVVSWVALNQTRVLAPKNDLVCETIVLPTQTHRLHSAALHLLKQLTMKSVATRMDDSNASPVDRPRPRQTCVFLAANRSELAEVWDRQLHMSGTTTWKRHDRCTQSPELAAQENNRHRNFNRELEPAQGAAVEKGKSVSQKKREEGNCRTPRHKIEDAHNTRRSEGRHLPRSPERFRW